MQSMIALLLKAISMAILIIIALLLLGAAIGFHEELVKRKIDVYLSAIGTSILLIIAILLFLTGSLSTDTLTTILPLLIIVLLCTDWSRLRRDGKIENPSE